MPVGAEVEDGSADGHGELAGLMMNCDTLHMAPSLAYHVKLLDVLAGTAVGRLNITTVEAKLQNLYQPKDLLVALLDSSMTLDVLVPVANFFYHAVIEVEIVVPDLCKNPDLWNYLEQCVGTFEQAKAQLDRMHDKEVKPGGDATTSRMLPGACSQRAADGAQLSVPTSPCTMRACRAGSVGEAHSVPLSTESEKQRCGH